MGIPQKAFNEADLTKIRRVGDSSHEVWYVSYQDKNGVAQTGYLKYLEPDGHFPEFLAKFSVFTSVVKTSFQGKASATEYLVFKDSGEGDENKRVCGVLSQSIDGFTPLNYASDKVPTNDDEKGKVIPNKEMLLKHKTLKRHFIRLVLGDDDGHPHNEDLDSDLDYDMFFYWFTVYMKGARPGIALPDPVFSFPEYDYENFPNIKFLHPFHWCAYTHPGQESIPGVLPDVMQKFLLSKALPKVYADSAPFTSLAADPEAHKQKFEAALEMLLTYQPDVLRKRLVEHFGDMPVNFTSLHPDKSNLYQQIFPNLCTSDTNKMPFVDFALALYKIHYDSVYRTVVFYMGCKKNNHGVPLLATYQELYTRPSLYTNIAQWIVRENETTYAREPENRLDVHQKLKCRYHQIWRDSFAPRLKEICNKTLALTNALCLLVTDKAGNIERLSGKEESDVTLTKALEIFGPLDDIQVAGTILVGKNTGLENALKYMVEFTNKLQAYIKNYYKKECDAQAPEEELTEKDNVTFTRGVNSLWMHYEELFLASVNHTTTPASDFVAILSDLKPCLAEMSFTAQLLSKDEHRRIPELAEQKILPITDERVLKQYNEALFHWVDFIKPEQFNQLILDVINLKYAPVLGGVASNRKRAPVVTRYLQTSLEHNSDKLAYILSSGNEPDGALNTEILLALTTPVLHFNFLPSVAEAFSKGLFAKNIGVVAQSAVKYAKNEAYIGQEEFIHLSSNRGITLFVETIYGWLGQQENYQTGVLTESNKNRFTKLVDVALGKYYQGLWMGNTKKETICRRFSDYSNQKALALTLLAGNDSSTSNLYLFAEIIKQIKSDIAEQPELLQQPGYRLIHAFHEEQNSVYVNLMRLHAVTVNWSHSLTNSTPVATSSTQKAVVLSV